MSIDIPITDMSSVYVTVNKSYQYLGKVLIHIARAILQIFSGTIWLKFSIVFPEIKIERLIKSERLLYDDN